MRNRYDRKKWPGATTDVEDQESNGQTTSQGASRRIHLNFIDVTVLQDLH